MRAAITCFIFALALLVAPARPELDRPLAARSYADRALSTGRLELAPGARDGRRRAGVGPLDVAMAMPGALAMRGLGNDSSAVGILLRSSFSILLLAALAVSFAARLRRSRYSVGTSIIVTAVLVSCTALVITLRRADATLLATLSLWFLLDEVSDRDAPGRPIKLGALGAILVLAMPAYTAAAVGAVLLQVLRRRAAGDSMGSASWLAAAGLVPVLLALVGVRIWDARLALAVEPSHAMFHALYGLLLSPGRSAFLYTPIALVGVLALPAWWARDRARADAVVVASLLALVGIARRADWHGEPGFGPSLVVPLLPFWVEAAAAMLTRGRAAKAWFAVAAASGLAVQLLGLAVDVNAWPRLMADVRAATGAPGWFLSPAADTEFIPQLSPLVGQYTLYRLSHGAPVGPPPFSLVVGSDQAEPAGKNSADQAFIETWNHFDKAKLRPNLAWHSATPTSSRLQLLVAFLLMAGAGLAARRAYTEQLENA